ncbi:hypothetical protein HZ326_29733 [Fusarium oxysporum f. sp. albedinis]|nr:hypothetical protein HZ326_29733 [Fusarium oxysporum f. sp. albedinis]
MLTDTETDPEAEIRSCPGSTSCGSGSLMRIGLPGVCIIRSAEALISGTGDKKPNDLLLETIKKSLTGDRTWSRFFHGPNQSVCFSKILGMITGFLKLPPILINYQANTKAKPFKDFRDSFEAEKGQQSESLNRAGHRPDSIAEVEKAHDSINLLLDLCHKQVSIKEAEFNRFRANDSARQSNSILISTIVTIIFITSAIISFISCRLDISSFPYECGNIKYQGWWPFPILCETHI